MTTDSKMTKHEENLPEETRTVRKVSPFVDIFENQDEILLFADMPGVSKEDVSIHIDKDVLRLEGHKNVPTLPGLVGGEIQSCAYVRSFSLPPTIDGDKISASLEHGVLKVSLPKRESLKPRQIQVTAG